MAEPADRGLLELPCGLGWDSIERVCIPANVRTNSTIASEPSPLGAAGKPNLYRRAQLSPEGGFVPGDHAVSSHVRDGAAWEPIDIGDVFSGHQPQSVDSQSGSGVGGQAVAGDVVIWTEHVDGGTRTTWILEVT